MPLKPDQKTARVQIAPGAGGRRGSNGRKEGVPIPTIVEDEDAAPSERAGEDKDDEYTLGKGLEKPDDQLQLTEEELKEDITRVLTASNPHAPQNIVRYSFKERCFKQVAIVDQLAIHFQMDGNLVHKDSDEATRQLKKSGDDSKKAAAAKAEKKTEETGTDTADASQLNEDDGDDVVAAPVPAGQKEKKLTNQFNFSERASQTYNNPLKERTVQTEPPPRATFSGNVTQWEIYDSYQDDFERTQKTKEKKPVPGRKETERKKRTQAQDTSASSDDLPPIGHLAKIIERMLNQNTYDEIAQDFKYWEDASDEFREQEGTLLPLWKFVYEKAKKMAVTSICWNMLYTDMFAVGHGSYDYTKQAKGIIAFYSLKNPSHPEFTFETESGVMSADIHPTYPFLFVVGLYNGAVAVYNMKEYHGGRPLFKSSPESGKHTDPVWQVKWQKDDFDSNLNFFSVSSDGRVTCWTIVKSELLHQDVIRLPANDVPADGPDGTVVSTFACGTTFDFHSKDDNMFLVGTEEGKVHICSKAYSSQPLGVLDAHSMAVYTVKWNPFHPRVFATCSADWTVKIWDSDQKSSPLFTFDLNSPVGDFAWAPYSATVFAAVTGDGKVYVYDLNVNKYEALCQQAVVQRKKTKLTHVTFNPIHPIVIVGDDRGYITSLKLSPNLRRQPKEKKGAAPTTKGPEVEIAKFDKLIELVKEPETKK